VPNLVARYRSSTRYLPRLPTLNAASIGHALSDSVLQAAAAAAQHQAPDRQGNGYEVDGDLA